MIKAGRFSTIKFFFCVFALFIFGQALKECLFALPPDIEKVSDTLGKHEKEVPEQPIIRPVVEYNAGELRDPFSAPATEGAASSQATDGQRAPEAQPPSLSVQGLIWGGKVPQAIINDTVVKTGDTVQGAKVIRISKEGVMVLFEGRQFNLSSPVSSPVTQAP